MPTTSAETAPAEHPPTPGGRWRRVWSSALLATMMAVVLSACFKLDMSLQLQPDDTVDGSVIIAVARDQAELLGGEDAIRDSLEGEGEGFFSEAPDQGTFEQRDYEDADWIGTEAVFSDVPISEFGSEGTEGTEGDDLSITREGDEFVVSGTLDLATDQQDAATQALLDTAELQIAITFPGEVTEANGEVDGTTVTWTPTAGEVLDISARGSAEGGTNWALIAAIAAVVVLVGIGVVLLVVVRGRAAPQPAAVSEAPAPPEGDGPPSTD